MSCVDAQHDQHPAGAILSEDAIEKEWMKTPEVFPYAVVADVHVDAATEKAFGDSDKWGIPVLCTQESVGALRCAYDGD